MTKADVDASRPWKPGAGAVSLTSGRRTSGRPAATQQEAIVEENDDKLFARALRRAALRSSRAGTYLDHAHLFLEQYTSSAALKLGELREERSLATAKQRMKTDRKNVELLLSAKDMKPNTKVDAEEEEAMAIEKLGKGR